MRKAVIYIHGKGGNAGEAEHYIPLFPEDTVIGFEYRSQTPWEAETEFAAFFDKVQNRFDSVDLIANSIGAFFTLCSLSRKNIRKAFFVSPVVQMERLIGDMMVWAAVDEAELRGKKRIPTPFGEVLSWEYLSWVREHPVSWTVPTEILYGENDNLQSRQTVEAFAGSCGAGVTVMKNGEHWFHTAEQMTFLDRWIAQVK